MTRLVVLLRAVNVGGRNRLAMSAFAAALESCGAADVRTYLQSGNAVVSWPDEPDRLAAEVSRALEVGSGLTVSVLVRSGAELADVVARSPFGEPADPKLLHVAFLSEPAPADRLAALDADRYAPDELAAGERELYLRYATGSGRSKLTVATLEKQLGVVGTARNWTTVTALRDLAGAAPR